MVLLAASADVHADLDAMIQQHASERLAGELQALVAIEDAWPTEPGDRSGNCPVPRAWLHRKVLPSTAMIASSLALKVAIQPGTGLNNPESRAAITTHNASWRGMQCS